MNIDYIEELANIADPEQLWRLSGMDQMDLPKDKRIQLDMGVYLRRYAQSIRDLHRALEKNQSVLYTPLSKSGKAIKFIDTPVDHKRLKRIK